MFGNINKNNVRGLGVRLNNDKFYDFMLYRGETYHKNVNDLCVAASFDCSKQKENDILVSSVTWENAINKDIILYNIGLTGVDNGFIKIERDRIDTKTFLDIFTKTECLLSGRELKLYPVNGSTKRFKYISDINDEFISFKGGFYQGFFKLKDECYELLPSKLNDEWNLEFVLRKRDYETEEASLNTMFPNNKGIFFYMGLRAENKFARYYNNEKDMWCEEGSLFPDGYIQEELGMKNLQILTNDGYDITEYGEYDIETDNKHIFFNRTTNGFTVNTWDEGNEVILREKKRKNINVFEIANHTKNGYQVSDINALMEDHQEYNIFQDLGGNCFALKINENGSLSYRYGIYDAQSDNQFAIKEEYTKSGIIENDVWYTVNAKFIYVGNNKMKILLYVNGDLIFISQELPSFNFRPINDVASKQEGVPYNISLGGGTQGLIEGVWKDYYYIHKNIVSPLAENFGGTFIGDIKTFKFYDCSLPYSNIKDNVVK